MGGKADRYFVPALVGFAPAVLALLTWAPYGLSPVQGLIRIDALPVFVVELVAFAIAWREGLLRWLRDHPPPRLAIAAIAVLVAISVATSLLVSPAEFAAVRWTVHWIVHLLFGFSIAFLCRRGLRVSDFTICFLAGYLLFVLIFLAFVLYSWTLPIDWAFDLPLSTHVRHIGIYSAAMTGVAIGAMAVARGRRAWGFAFVCATIGFAVGLWTGSRGMVVSVAGATLAGVVLVPEIRNAKAWAGAGLGLVIAIAAVAWLPVPNGKMMGISRTVTATTEHEVTTGRLQIWDNVVHAIGQKPAFGYGPGQMGAVAPFGRMGQPHNIVLQVALDWGLVGLACVLVLAVFYLRRAIPAVHRNGAVLACPLLAMLSIFLLSMIDAALFHVLPVAIFAACAGMIAANWQPQRMSRNEG
ncbi:MAG TPA: O-antigen ligase family protein [Sphingomicrobium sp.]|jgi:O-antigen ligase|nr:O-antigen ligase family protein [Sphingomicrobium sp.]